MHPHTKMEVDTSLIFQVTTLMHAQMEEKYFQFPLFSLQQETETLTKPDGREVKLGRRHKTDQSCDKESHIRKKLKESASSCWSDCRRSVGEGADTFLFFSFFTLLHSSLYLLDWFVFLSGCLLPVTIMEPLHQHPEWHITDTTSLHAQAVFS